MHFRSGPRGLLCIWIALAVSSVAAQQTLEVPGQFKTIQAAIDAARDKDMIRVSPGVYHENIDFKGKRIRLESTTGFARTTIDGRHRGSVVTFSGGEDLSTVFAGFTLINGSGTVDRLFMVGGGICCRNASPTIWGVLVEHNQVFGVLAYGGGIYVNGGSPQIVDSVVAHNEASAWGGGICIIDSGAHVTRCTIRDNRSDLGGGVLFSGGTPTLTNSVLMKNVARGGGGVYAALGAPAAKTFTNNTIVDNKATQFGGGIASASDVSAVANTILWSNAAPAGPQLWLGRDCSVCIPSALTIDHSDVQGGSKNVFQQTGATLMWGAGMIDADPDLAHSKRTDPHLSYTSPCVDRGSKEARHLPQDDLDGDARFVGAAVDIGADEFAPRLYQRERAYLGTTLEMAIAGAPGTPVVWAYSIRLANPPLEIPGAGKLFLNPNQMALFFPGLMPGNGVLSISMAIPKGIPYVTLPFQAVSTGRLTNHIIVEMFALE